MQRDLEKFIQNKEKTIELIEDLIERLADCIDTGMLDENSILYNTLISFLDDANSAGSYFELGEVIHHCKQIEKNLETWLSSIGQTTHELTWPQINEER